jgi:predicted ATP-grasp superfamily ATP-dependent carboligase
MNIFVHEFVTGGGFASRGLPLSLAREGAAMRAALVSDLEAAGHRVVTTADAAAATLASIARAADAAWLVAPETDRCLERLTARFERTGARVLGSSAAAVRQASDKGRLAARLRDAKIAHPDTRLVPPDSPFEVARDLGYPLVIKPVRGAGCVGVQLARNARELRGAVARAYRAPVARAGRTAGAQATLLIQRYIRGVHASVSLLAGGTQTLPLAVNRQSIRTGRTFTYIGGSTPLDHPMVRRAIRRAVQTCEAIPGLRGFVGVDMVLTDREAFVIEVNARLTTAYLGVRASLGRNVAAMAIDACEGRLPRPVVARRRVRFSASGRVTELTGSDPIYGLAQPLGSTHHWGLTP